MQAVVNDTLVQYTDEGKGPVLLCVHGWMHDSSSFKELTEELKDSYRLVALDLPNFGKSQVNDDVTSLGEYAQFIQAFADKLGITDYIYAGHSMGGQIGVRGVGGGILSPKKLLLIDAAGVRDTRRVYKLFIKLMSRVLRYITPKRLKGKFYKMIGSDYNPDLAPVHKKIIDQTLKDDIQQDAGRIKVPTLLIFGSEDTSTPLWMGQKLRALIPGAKLEVIDGENHWPHQTASDKVAAIVRRFCS